MVCDSTNAQVEGTTGSEGQARAGLAEAFRGRKGAIAVTCFASNVARMKAIAEAAAANDRKVVLAGRSLLRMEKAARACGYLDGLQPFLSLSEASNVARRNLVLICTGSQGEERSALSKIARAEHRSLALQPGDTVIFSARTIPGNEDAIAAIYKLLTQMGVSIVTPSDAPVHVSGHPARGDLTRMYELVRPRFAVPVHGEIHHLEAHARLARGCGVERALVPEDGDVIRLGRYQHLGDRSHRAAPAGQRRPVPAPLGRLGRSDLWHPCGTACRAQVRQSRLRRRLKGQANRWSRDCRPSPKSEGRHDAPPTTTRNRKRPQPN